MNAKRVIASTLLRSTVATALAMAATGALALTDTSSLPVTASVANNCVIDASAGLDFGPYDPVTTNAATPLDGSGDIAVTCTLDAPASITLGQGANAAGGSTDAAPLRQLNDGGTNNLAYNLFTSNTYGTVWDNTTGVGYTGTGAATAVTVYGRIPAGQNVPAGSYADSVLATITF